MYSTFTTHGQINSFEDTKCHKTGHVISVLPFLCQRG